MNATSTKAIHANTHQVEKAMISVKVRTTSDLSDVRRLKKCRKSSNSSIIIPFDQMSESNT